MPKYYATKKFGMFINACGSGTETFLREYGDGKRVLITESVVREILRKHDGVTIEQHLTQVIEMPDWAGEISNVPKWAETNTPRYRRFMTKKIKAAIRVLSRKG